MICRYLIVIYICLFFSCQERVDPISEPEVDSLYFPPVNGSEWESTDPESLGWDVAGLNELLDLLEVQGTRAFLIVKDGKLVVEAYFGQNILGNAPFTSETAWYWASAGKTLTAFMVGKAQQEGYLNLEDPTHQYLGNGWTSLGPQQETEITLKHQLNMTTGLDDSGYLDGTEPEDLKFLAEPGSRWSYHNAPYTLLEKVVAEAVNSPFTQYFRLKLANPIGMEGQWVWIGDNHVYFSNARSMARFGLLMLSNGKWQDQVILEDQSYFMEMIQPSQQLNLNYGYLWWLNQRSSYMVPRLRQVFPGAPVPSAPEDMYSGIGRDGQIVSIVPSQKLVVVRMGDNPDDSLVPFLLLEVIWEELQKIIP